MQPIEAPKCARLLEQIELEMKREHVWQEAPLELAPVFWTRV